MAKEFKLPELGENITSGDIINVNVSVGDEIEVDQVLFEVETDKATIEVPSDVAGKITEILVSEGDTAEVGQALLKIDESGGGSEKKKEEPKAAEEETKKEPEEENSKEPAKSEQKSTGYEVGEVKIPELGENIEQADVTKILVSVGDTVKEGDNIIELETEKASMEVPTEVSGEISEILISEGDTVTVGQAIMKLKGASTSAKKEEEPEKEEVEEEKTEPAKTPEVTQEVKGEKTQPEPPITTAKMAKERFKGIIAPAAPSVRRFSREIGIDINNVKGSGPGGRISIDDVKKYAKNLNQKIESGTAGGAIQGIKHEPLPDFKKWGEIDTQKMSNVRKKTAEHLSYAWATVPHVTQFDKANITELEKLRKQYSKVAEKEGGKLTVTAILLKVVATALKKFPQFNASVDMENNEIIYKKYVNIGIAVDTDRGLIVPVIRDVDKKNIVELAVELSEISKKARDRKVSLEDMQGGNFTISNLGGIGGTAFTPIVNSPEVAILGVSRGGYEPVYEDGGFIPKLMLPLSLSYDHRVIDGADGARFIKWISNALEQPLLLALEG